jgi:uncharacterized integral membrane protein
MQQAVIGHAQSESRLGVKATDRRREIPETVRAFCFWAAAAMAATYIVFIAGYIANGMALLPVPWDQIVAVGASILIAPSFVLLVVGLHYFAPEAKRIWTHGAIGFGLLYAAFVSLVYVTLLFVVEPHVINHTESEVAPFLFAKGSFTQMVDGLGYTYMSLAVGLTFPIFFGGRLASWIRWIAILSLPSALGVLIAYIAYSFPYELLGIGSFLVPLYGVLVAIYFRKQQVRLSDFSSAGGNSHG